MIDAGNHGCPRRDERSCDAGSTIPLILGFFLLALLMVAGSIALGEAFVQQRDLQDVCDGAAAAAAAAAPDLDRGTSVPLSGSVPFADVGSEVRAYLDRDPQRQHVVVRTRLSGDRRRITLTCRQRTRLTFGQFFGRANVTHTATSSSRAAVSG